MEIKVAQKHTASTRSPLLQAIGLGRRAADRMLLHDIDISVYGGDRVALVGPTGSGKTVLLRTLAMLDPFTAGEILWHCHAIQEHDVPHFRSRVIYLHQRPVLMEGTVEDNLRQPFSLRVHGDKHFNRARIVDLLESLKRSDLFLSKHQRDLSGGEAQLTALLRAVQLDPEILLLDEPTAALDAEATSAVETLINRWLAEQPTARASLWVTHDRNQARRVSSALRAIRDGRLIGDGE